MAQLIESPEEVRRFDTRHGATSHHSNVSRTRPPRGEATPYASAVSALLALASSMVWGTSDFFAGLLTRRHPVAVVVGWSQTLGFLVLSVIVATRWGSVTSWDWLPWSVLAALIGVVGLLCFYQALATGTMGVVAPIATLGVVVPVVLGVLTGETPRSITWIGMITAMIGATLASGPELSGAVSPRPVILAAISAVCFGCVMFLIHVGSATSALMTIWGMRATSFTIFVIAALAMRTVGEVRPRDLPLLAFIGCGDALANILFGLASTAGHVSVASVLGSLYALVTIVLARVILREHLLPVQKGGIVLAMLGAAIIAA